VSDADGSEYFTSYVLDEFVIYRTPEIKSMSEVVRESEESPTKTGRKANLERTKGQGEFELPSAVYVAWSVKSLGIHQRIH
jgi:hypothetical protein